MMENGVRPGPLSQLETNPISQTISEFGTHDELLQKGGSYAALYQASV